MVEIVFLLKFSNIFHKDFKVIGIVLFLWSIKALPLRHLSLAVYANVEKHRNYVKFHILKTTL